MARLALISDIHGNAVALEAVLRDIETQHVDAVFVLGDLVNRGADPARCLALLGGIPAVSGNGDDYVVQGFEENQQMGPPDSWRSRPLPPWPSDEALRLERRWAAAQLRPEDVASLRDLPTVLHHPLRTDTALLMCHATPTDRQALVFSHSPTAVLYDTFFAPYPGVRMAAYGHTHIPYVRFLKGVVVVNTGSVGTPTDGALTASYAMVEVDGSDLEVSLRRVAYDVGRACARLLQADYPPMQHLWPTGYGPGLGPGSIHRSELAPVKGCRVGPKPPTTSSMHSLTKRIEEGPTLIHAVFFDLDKTLLDPDGAYHTVTQQVLGPIFLAADGSLDTLRAALDSIWPPLWETVMAGGLRDDIYPEWFQAAFAQAGLDIGEHDSRQLASHYYQRFETGLKPLIYAV